MKFFNHLPFIQNLFTTKNTTFYKKTPAGYQFSLKGNRSYRFEAGIKDLEDAIARAKDIDFPSRDLLYRIYQSNSDLHVKSQIRTAVFKVVGQPWHIVDQSGKPNKNATELLKKKWFDVLNKHIVQTEFWGHSLLYFYLGEHGEITQTKLFPRVHVNPETQSIIPDLGDPQKRVPYKDNPIFQSVFIEVGQAGDLGVLQDIMRHSILKSYALKDWARSSEKWGDPHVILQSAAQSEAENDEKEAFLKNFGNNGYAIIDREDEVKLLERTASGNSHHIFLDFIKVNNEENSKGINGQVATADEKAFVGSAEVQERILNDYTESRLRSLMYFHNEVTLPFLTTYNGGHTVYGALKGMRWIPALFDEETINKKEEKSQKKQQDNHTLNSSFFPLNSQQSPFG